MLAGLSDYFFWWQIPLLAAFLVLGLIGGWILLWIGGRFIAKSPKATLGRAFVTNLLAGLAGFVAMGLASGGASAVAGPAGGVVGWGVSLLVVWLVIKGMFGVSFGKAILAWLPSLPVGIISTALLVAALMPTLGRARQIAQIAMCASNLKTMGSAVQLYAAEHDRPPGNVQVLIDSKSLQPGHLRCYGAKPGRVCDFFIHFPAATPSTLQALVACDLKGNHFDGSRNVLTYGGSVHRLRPKQFQAELARPHNAEFAEALRAAEGP